MATEKRLIDANAMHKFVEDMVAKKEGGFANGVPYEWAYALTAVDIQPTVDAVDAEKYNDLRDAFVDFVCSGVPNPAPYCKNKNGMCVNGFGWCLPESGNCQGFNPDGTKMDGERKDDDIAESD